jgi:hypothetical protein
MHRRVPLSYQRPSHTGRAVGRSAGIVLAREYISILATSKRATDPGAREALDKQSRELADAQLLVARLTDAQGLITVRQGHSLSSIAAFFYRNRNRWRDCSPTSTSSTTRTG